MYGVRVPTLRSVWGCCCLRFVSKLQRFDTFVFHRIECSSIGMEAFYYMLDTYVRDIRAALCVPRLTAFPIET